MQHWLQVSGLRGSYLFDNLRGIKRSKNLLFLSLSLCVANGSIAFWDCAWVQNCFQRSAHAHNGVSNVRARGIVFFFLSFKSSDLNENCLLNFSSIEFPRRFIEHMSSYYPRQAGRGDFHQQCIYHPFCACRCGPFWALASLKRSLHSFLSQARLHQSRIPRICSSALICTTSYHRAFGFPIDLLLWNFLLRTFSGERSPFFFHFCNVPSPHKILIVLNASYAVIPM